MRCAARRTGRSWRSRRRPRAPRPRRTRHRHRRSGTPRREHDGRGGPGPHEPHHRRPALSPPTPNPVDAPTAHAAGPGSSRRRAFPASGCRSPDTSVRRGRVHPVPCPLPLPASVRARAPSGPDTRPRSSAVRAPARHAGSRGFESRRGRRPPAPGGPRRRGRAVRRRSAKPSHVGSNPTGVSVPAPLSPGGGDASPWLSGQSTGLRSRRTQVRILPGRPPPESRRPCGRTGRGGGRRMVK